MKKTCNRCHKKKPLIEFPKHPTAKNQRTNPCKACKKQYQIDYRNGENVPNPITVLMRGWPRG